jgi:hypothetical protein
VGLFPSTARAGRLPENRAALASRSEQFAWLRRGAHDVYRLLPAAWQALDGRKRRTNLLASSTLSDPASVSRALPNGRRDGHGPAPRHRLTSWQHARFCEHCLGRCRAMHMASQSLVLLFASGGARSLRASRRRVQVCAAAGIGSSMIAVILALSERLCFRPA